ncbi:AfsR/SARP family transcriptional regulator [Streptomyces sp. NBC_00637]|uniref:AfsR/SARP family transcriptional regulator n=1 Tax=Streptomyces sp. NBC_00637 TaxID=2903667 RepID=UPI0032435A7D
MNIRLMGTFEITLNGAAVMPTAPKPRQLLALLALHAGRVVSVASLTEELWGDRPPRTARTILQTYVLQLRELITAALGRGQEGDAAGRTAKDVLVTAPGGYLLDNAGATLDVQELERLTGVGYRAMHDGDFQGAARHLGEALALWTGPAFADVQAGPQLEMEARRLEEMRLCALDQRIEAELRLGRHRDLLVELTVLVNRYPTHENLHGQYMLALHRSGRRGEALEAYRRIRATLVRELGLEPSAGLRRVQQMILMAGPETGPARAANGRRTRLVRSS